jgi:DNA-binding transcriptional regulator YiaG
VDFTLRAVTLTALLAGTGFTNAPLPAINGTYTAQFCTQIIAPEVAIEAASLRALLGEIRSNFQLNATELALILDVSRPTLYSWSSEKSKPRPSHIRRLKALREASVYWREMIGDRTDTVAQRFDDKEQLVELLSAPTLSITTALPRLVNIAKTRVAVPRTASLADRLKELGFANQSVAEQSRALEGNGW